MEGIISFENYQFGYSITGQSNRPLVLFLHGFMGDRRDFTPITSRLIDQYQCLAIDLPGHGKTQVVEEIEYGMVLTARAIVGVLDQLHISKCFLVGYSMGGRLALYLTLHFPERFIKTVLESASPGLKTEEERERRSQQDWHLATKLETVNLTEFLKKWYEQPLFASMKRFIDGSKISSTFDQVLERRQQNQPHELAKSLRNIGTGSQPSLWAELAQMRVPLLLLVGESDQKFLQINQEMVTHCPAAQLQVVKDCGHNIHLEKVQDFVEVLREFLLTP